MKTSRKEKVAWRVIFGAKTCFCGVKEFIWLEKFVGHGFIFKNTLG